ncbi:MAG: hypothetical protein A4E28_00859 [Methanocella sp. PtaU1.Bin125]|nr:MAG: hypothetical protein A4E28_00859 [Methanocella sp. PtaU1.Bin125]
MQPAERVAILLLTVPAFVAVLFMLFVALVMAPLYIHEESVKYPGSYASLFLNEYAPCDRIVIEVHYQGNATPSTYALEHLRSRLHYYTGRPVDLYTFGDIGPGAVPEVADSNNLSSFGYDIIEQNARCHTGWLGGNATIYILYVDLKGRDVPHNGSGVVAGMSYRADAFFVFDNYVYDEVTERTVLMHEAGHLLGLEHDDDPECAMVGTMVRNRSVLMGLTPTPDDYCQAHRRQLENLRNHLVV